MAKQGKGIGHLTEHFSHACQCYVFHELTLAILITALS